MQMFRFVLTSNTEIAVCECFVQMMLKGARSVCHSARSVLNFSN